MKFLNTEIAPLGMGCWPIGGAMYAGDRSLGYTNSTDAEAIRTIHAALDHGITLFDTAAAYGAGHADRLLGQALAGRSGTQIVSKIGIRIDEATRQLTFGDTAPDRVIPAIDDCLARLNRDCIDLMLLHDNALPIDQAEPIFDAMEQARAMGKIRAFGWSTDFSASARAVAQRDGFGAVEHAMNVFVDAPRIQQVVADHGAVALIRSPLAMGLLTDKYGADAALPTGDIRAGDDLVIAYFKDGRPNPEFLQKRDAVRDLLTVDGRSLVQGALGWLWAKGAANIPIPGARTVDQITGIAGALEHGPLPAAILEQITEILPATPLSAPEQEL